MALVDPEDDSATRYVVWHYRYDPDRRERRNVTIAAYDNEVECIDEIRRLSEQLEQRKADALAEALETISGVVKPPGLDAERLLRRSLRGPRGVRERVRKRRRGQQ